MYGAGKKKTTGKRHGRPKSKCETITIGETTFTLKYSQSLPSLVDQEFADLVKDISSHGIFAQIIIDEAQNVIDGAHRLRAAHILGQKKIPILVVPGLCEDKKHQMALALNLHRRHLTPLEIARVAKQNKELLPQMAIRLRQKGQSYRQIAGALGVSHEWVRSKIHEATVNKKAVDLPDVIVGKDGKKRAAKVKPKLMSAVQVNSISEIHRASQACNTAGPDRLPNKTIPLKRAEKIANEKIKENLRNRDYKDLRMGKAKLLLGDFRKRCSEISDTSVDVVFTDPLYKKDALPIWGDLGEMCSKKLKPGGILIAYSGVLYLPQIHKMLGEHLTYLWTAAIRHTGRIKLVRAVQIQQAWKPILIYYKPPLQKYWRPFMDMVSGGQEKEHHIYEQAVGEALHYIQAFCPRNGILWDPMMGSATTLEAGLTANLGLTCIGCEVDKAAYSTAQKRIKETIDILQAKKESA